MFDTILLATDASSDSEALLACAQRLAIPHRSKVVVVFVGAASSVSRRVRRQVEQLRKQGVYARLAVVADGRDKGSVIARLVTVWSADLVMVDGGGAGGDLDLTQRIMESSPCPVLAIPGLASAG